MNRTASATIGAKPTIVLAANSAWNIVNFRGGLVRALKEAGYEPLVVAPADPACEERMGRLGVEQVPLELDRSGMSPVADARLFFAYRRLLLKFRPLAFLGFTSKPNIYGSLAARTVGVPAIANISGLGTAFLGRGGLMKFVTSLYRLALRRTDVVFFHNRDDLELFLELKLVSADQAGLLPGSGIDLQQFESQPLPRGGPIFLLVARLLGDKGVREFAAAARIVRQEHRNARFQLLGPIDDGNRTAITWAELDGWVASGAVEYLGVADDVRPFIGKATAIVLPSYREGLPRSLLEGAAMARPLVTTDVPGCREVVEDGVNGYLCAVRSATALAEAMDKLCRLTVAERRSMGLAGRAMVARRFDEKLVVGAYLERLRQLEPSARPPALQANAFSG